jgi:AmmeMemoRadiSam system protein B/AmmeMemoRadiSam system protein A
MDISVHRIVAGAILLTFIAAVLLVGGCARKKAKTSKQISQAEPKKQAEQPSVVLCSKLADRGWYPKEPDALRAEIKGFFEKAKAEPLEGVIALIQPHAGYFYSAQTAACGLKSTDKKYERVVIIGPSHRVPMDEILSVPRVTHYETPLGQIEVDTEFVEELLKHPVFQNVPYVHESEHSVQIQLPLLQYRLGDFKLVPIVAGSCSLDTIRKAASILKGMVDEQTLVIASSDFVHYGPNYGYVPFTSDVPEQIKKLDMGAFEYIAALDAEGFLEYKRKTGATICGSVPIAVLLSMLGEGTTVKLLNYNTSGALTGSFTNSVSYLSVAFSGRWPESEKVEPAIAELSEQDRQQLLTLARKTILYILQNQRVPSPSDLGVEISETMNSPRAAFVTLKKRTAVRGKSELRLRGCIGDILPRAPLYKSVIVNAINASMNDRRFPPLRMEEYNEIVVEISALTTPQPVEEPNDIRIGVDGVILQKDGRSAVFLPQVAPEQGWDVSEMLTHLSLKAGLPSNAWRQGAQFLVFQAEVFGEEK